MCYEGGGKQHTINFYSFLCPLQYESYLWKGDFTMKKFLSFLFTFIMIFSFATVSASASVIEAQDMDCYAADGVSVSVTDATEPVDVSACVASSVGSTVPPVYSTGTVSQ